MREIGENNYSSTFVPNPATGHTALIGQQEEKITKAKVKASIKAKEATATSGERSGTQQRRKCIELLTLLELFKLEILRQQLWLQQQQKIKQEEKTKERPPRPTTQ